jgi:hypothetical protein
MMGVPRGKQSFPRGVSKKVLASGTFFLDLRG